jgi:REP element-mobilizing transposase RayT
MDMPRQMRREFAGAIYHVMNRGDRREEIFRDEPDRRMFLATLTEACGKTEWQIHAYCLMRNHFHLVVETPQANLVAGMKWLLGVYTQRFNLRHQECGHLFAGRYKALQVEGSGGGYLRTVCDYVHLNPARAGLLQGGQPLQAFLWSSYGEYLKPARRRPGWLRVDRLLGEKGIPKDSAAGRREFARQTEARRREDLAREFKPVERGWCLGSKEFRQELLAAAEGRLRATHYGAERREAQEAKALRLLQEEMGRAGWDEEALRQAGKGDARKVRLAARLRKETTMSLKWIAQRLEMGSWTHVSNLLAAARKVRSLKSEN